MTGAYQVKIAMLDILRLRRSIRKYRDKEIEREIVDQLKEAALRSPTSRGIVNGGVKLSNYGGIKLTTNLKSFFQA